MVGAVAEVDARRVACASRKERGADDDDDRDGDLRDDESSAKALVCSPTRPSRARLEHVRQVRSTHREHRHDRGENGREPNHEESKPHDAVVDGHRPADRHVRPDANSGERSNRDLRENDCADAAHRREHQALDQHSSRQSPLRCTERGPNRVFLVLRRGSGEEETRDVCAGDGQDEQDQQHERGGDRRHV
jgi:hypothetical protein